MTVGLQLRNLLAGLSGRELPDLGVQRLQPRFAGRLGTRFAKCLLGLLHALTALVEGG